jgi:DNA-binding MarR family transcriptional regulator
MSSPSLDRAQLFEALNHQTQLLAAIIVLFEQAAADRLNLNVLHLHCANMLRLMGPMTAGQLAELTGLTTGAVTGMIDRLERVGYVRRESDPHDRRRVVVQAESEVMERDIGPLYESLARASAAMYANYSNQELALLLEHHTRNNALTLDEAIKLRRTAAQASQAHAGSELRGEHITLPLGSVQAGQLIVTPGAARLSVQGQSAQHDLLRAHFGTLAPSVFVQDGLVKVFYQHAQLSLNEGTADLTLNSTIPWQLELGSSGAVCTADLRLVLLSALDVNGTASTFEVTLPHPTTSVPCRVAGAASSIVVRRPVGIALQVRLRRGGSTVVIDGRNTHITASKPYQTPDYANASARYDIDITARTSKVTIETYQ